MNETRQNHNRLSDESSPYLLQHASNPVDWYPWGDEAFERARREDKPVFLSVGYSTCHWCHVMAHESFEDADVAGILNDHFISVKLDREERPDIDQLYMSFVHALTGRGGWPMSVFLTPDRKPFFAGTYFPKHSRGGQTGFTDVLGAIHNAWINRKEDVLRSSDEILRQLGEKSGSQDNRALSETIPDLAFEHLSSAHDQDYGGFGSAPKFPTPHHLLFLLRYRAKTGNADALSMVERTLKTMRNGGVFDQLDGGFHRYSTDRRWFLPHFEKMLYDQAMMSLAYIETYQITQKEFYRTCADEILSFVMNNLSSPEGGFYSAYDADSEGEEGKYYLWTEAELKSALNPDDYYFAKCVWNTLPDGNHSDESTGHSTGFNILHQIKDSDVLAHELGLSESEYSVTKERVRNILLSVREKRIPPFLDDKILTDWNGLMIAAMAKASSVFHSRKYLESAESAADFIFKRLRNPDGRLLKRYRMGASGLDSHLDDYAFMVWGLIELYESTAKPAYLSEAIALSKIMITDFLDGDQQGFYLASGTATDLILRNKECYDGAYPSGNSVAAHNLIRLGRMTGNTDWITMAEQIGTAFAGPIQRIPTGFTHYLSAQMMLIEPGQEIIVTGNPDTHEYQNITGFLRKKYNPDSVMIFRDDRDPDEIHRLIPSLRDYPRITDGVACYVCRKQACSPALRSVEELEKLFQ